MRPWLRRLDLRAAQRVNRFAANSRQVRERIRTFYDRDAEVIYPPLETDRFPLGDSRADWYLMVGRLVRYKGFDRVIEVVNATGRRLKIAGQGPDGARLRSIAGPGVEFLGYVPDGELVTLYQGARALIVPAEDDWGMAVLEANCCGCPVVAAAWGGSLESVLDGRSGVLYQPLVEGGLAAALDRFEALDFDPQVLRTHAMAYREEIFHDRVRGIVQEALEAA